MCLGTAVVWWMLVAFCLGQDGDASEPGTAVVRHNLSQTGTSIPPQSFDQMLAQGSLRQVQPFPDHRRPEFMSGTEATASLPDIEFGIHRVAHSSIEPTQDTAELLVSPIPEEASDQRDDIFRFDDDSFPHSTRPAAWEEELAPYETSENLQPIFGSISPQSPGVKAGRSCLPA